MNIKVNCPYIFAKTTETSPGYVLRNPETITFQPGEFKEVTTGCLFCIDPEDKLQLTSYKRRGESLPPTFETKKTTLGVDCQIRLAKQLSNLGFLANNLSIDELSSLPLTVNLFYFGKDPYTIEAFSYIADLVIGSFIPCIVENKANFP